MANHLKISTFLNGLVWAVCAYVFWHNGNAEGASVIYHYVAGALALGSFTLFALAIKWWLEDGE